MSDTTTIYTGPDTRGKMYIYYRSGRIDSLCFGSTTVFSINNKPMLLPNHDLVDLLDALQNGHPRVFTEAEMKQNKIEDNLSVIRDSIDRIKHHKYELEEDSLLKNPLHCYLMELVLENKDITSILGIDINHYENATIFNGELYFNNCIFDEKFNKVKFIKHPDNPQWDAYRPYCYITFFGWNTWEEGKYSILIYTDREKSVDVTFKINNGIWVIDHYEHYDK